MREDAKCTFSLSIHLLQLFDGHPLNKDSPGFPGDKLALRPQNQLNFLSTVRNDLQIAEYFESVFAECNANPRILVTTEWNADIWAEDAEGFPRDRSLVPVLATHTDQPGSWFALSNLRIFSKEPTDKAWVCLTAPEDWRDMHPTALAILNL
jgi:hypothetical protein